MSVLKIVDGHSVIQAINDADFVGGKDHRRRTQSLVFELNTIFISCMLWILETFLK